MGALDQAHFDALVRAGCPACKGPTLEIRSFGHQGVMRVDQGWVSNSYGALQPAPSCVFSARAEGPRDVVSFFVPRHGNQAAVDIHEQAATNGRALVIGGPLVEDVLLVGGGGEAAGGELSSDAQWAWVRASRRDEAVSEFRTVIRMRRVGIRR